MSNGPTAAKVAAPKKPTKAQAQAAALESRTNHETSGRRPIFKTPYNFRVRSLARSFVDAIDDPSEKKRVRAELRECTSYCEIRSKALVRIDETEWDKFIADWFAAGVEKDKTKE